MRSNAGSFPLKLYFCDKILILKTWQLASENVIALSEQNTSQVLYFKNSSIGINSWWHCLPCKKFILLSHNSFST